jgi:Flp pilus assembly protein TadG
LQQENQPMLARKQTTARSATAAVELAVCLPMLLIVLTGIWEVGRMVQVQNVVWNAAREGGRQAAAGLSSNATVVQFMVNYLNANGLTGVTTSMVTLTNVTSSARSNPNAANQMDQFQVNITVPYSTIQWSTVAQITPTQTLTASTTWYSMLDNPCVVSTTIPSN